MNFDLNEDQREIKDTARKLLAARFRPAHLRALAQAGAYDGESFEELAGLGWAGIAITEDLGGAGLGLVEMAVIQEELGYVLAPVPFLSAIAAALVLAEAGSDSQRKRWLGPLVSGEIGASVGLAVEGHAALVPDAGGASFVILVDDGRASLFEASDVEVACKPTMDLTRHFGLVRTRGQGEDLPGDVRHAMCAIQVALAAECVGVAQRAMEMAVQYAKDRKQFGHPIGVNQAVSHRLAQMLLETESARSCTYYAAWAGDHDREVFPAAAAAAKAYSSDAGSRVPASALQVHGGIGFTWEHDLHFWVKRGRLNAALYGTPHEHRQRLASLIFADKAVPRSAD
jgi:alkylation response protein AidB-like acyl-CoA dehydrogenase